jgi:uncharacterized protein (TIGR02284 family)
MANASERLVQALNLLIETCKDAEEGFRTAARGVTMRDVKKLLNGYSAQRARFAVELRAEVERLGGTPTEGGSVAARLHRGWTSLKSLVVGSDAGAVLAGCDRGEEAAVRNYETALRGRWPAGLRPILARQFEQLREAHSRIRALGQACARATAGASPAKGEGPRQTQLNGRSASPGRSVGTRPPGSRPQGTSSPVSATRPKASGRA